MNKKATNNMNKLSKMKNMKMINFTSNYLIIALILSGILFSGCGTGKKQQDEGNADKFEALISYIESNHDFINTDESPAVVGADEVMKNINGNIHIIDIRTPEDYNSGHVSGSVNVAFKDLINYFEQKINPASFDHIYVFSSDGQASFFSTGLLQLLGYKNVHPVRYGMSAWDKGIADQYWLKKISSKYSAEMTTEPFPIPQSGEYPVINSEFTDGYDILRERAEQLLQQPFIKYVADIDVVIADPSKYHIVCYWKEEYYNAGHITGAIHYVPKKSLSRNTYLNTLPLNKPILVYCNSGNHSSTVSAYLRILGYDAYSLHYGTNSFMYDIMKEKTGHTFSDDQIMNYPLVRQEKSESSLPAETKKTVPQGGC
jgi:rhodanese-related sulfurtransferase